MKITVVGDVALRKALAKLAESYPRATAAALYQEGFAIDALAVARTPVDTGRLRATHYVAPPQRDFGGPVVEVGFGTDYAAAVHNVLDVDHLIGQTLFLESAFKERVSGWEPRMAARIRENAARGIGAEAIPAMAPTRPKDPGKRWQAKKQIARRKRAAKEKKRAVRKGRQTARAAKGLSKSLLDL